MRHKELPLIVEINKRICIYLFAGRSRPTVRHLHISVIFDTENTDCQKLKVKANDSSLRVAPLPMNEFGGGALGVWLVVVVVVAVIDRCLGEEGVYATARMRNEVSIGNIFCIMKFSQKLDLRKLVCKILSSNWYSCRSFHFNSFGKITSVCFWFGG